MTSQNPPGPVTEPSPPQQRKKQQSPALASQATRRLQSRNSQNPIRRFTCNTVGSERGENWRQSRLRRALWISDHRCIANCEPNWRGIATPAYQRDESRGIERECVCANMCRFWSSTWRRFLCRCCVPSSLAPFFFPFLPFTFTFWHSNPFIQVGSFCCLTSHPRHSQSSLRLRVKEVELLKINTYF